MSTRTNETADTLAVARQILIGQLIGARRAAGMTHADVAQRMEMTPVAIGQLERQTNWYLSTIQAYALAVDCALDLRVREIHPWMRQNQA